MLDTLTESTRFDVHLPGVRFARVAANAVADSAPKLIRYIPSSLASQESRNSY